MPLTGTHELCEDGPTCKAPRCTLSRDVRPPSPDGSTQGATGAGASPERGRTRCGLPVRAAWGMGAGKPPLTPRCAPGPGRSRRRCGSGLFRERGRHGPRGRDGGRACAPVRHGVARGDGNVGAGAGGDRPMGTLPFPPLTWRGSGSLAGAPPPRRMAAMAAMTAAWRWRLPLVWSPAHFR